MTCCLLQTVPIGLVFLLGSLVITMVAVPTNNWKLTKNFGILHVCYYLLFVLVLVLVEVRAYW